MIKKKSKISPHQYAQLLLVLTQNKTRGEAEGMVRNFVSLLKKNSAIFLAERIIKEYEKLCLAQKGLTKLEIETAFRLLPRNKKGVLALARERLGGEKFETEEKICPKIKAGFILRSDNKIIDLSLAGFIKILERALLA